MIMYKILLFILVIVFTVSSVIARDFRETESIINQILRQNREAETVPQDFQEEEEAQPNQRQRRDRRTRTAPTAAEELNLYRIGIQFYESASFDSALQHFNDLLERFPQSQYADSARLWRGKTLMKQRAFRDAISTFAAVSENSGEFPAALYNTGLCHVFLRQPNQAIAAFQRIIIQFPESDFADRALLESAQVHLQQKNGRRAVESLVRIINSYPNRETVADAYYHLARVFEQDSSMRDIEAARNLLRQFLRKAEQGERIFRDSPLRERAAADLNRIERTHFRHEN
jgi:TolA-binding protein